MNVPHRTTIATLRRIRPDLVEVRYDAGCTLTPALMSEVQSARRRIMGDAHYGMITLLPPDVDFELPAMHTDHLKEDKEEQRVLAIAVVAEANMLEMLVKLYFSYYPQKQRVHVTDNEVEARAWLDAQLTELGGLTSVPHIRD